MADHKQDLAVEVVAALRAAFPSSKPLALHEPRFQGNEWQYVKECIDTGWVSSVGRFVNRFEADLAVYTGAKHAIAVANGTLALHVALMVAGVVADDEVLVPSLTFVATANAVTYCHAVPHFVDSDERTLGISAEALREHLRATAEMRGGVCFNRASGRPIRALVPMHTFGHPVDLEGVLAVARDYGLIVIEDAAESLGSYYFGRHTGTFGPMGVLSFNGNKTVTTGGGGAVLTNDPELARRLKHLTTTAKVPHPWEYFHDEVGYNYRLPNLNAALGCAQLEQLPDFLWSKRRLYEHYAKAFASVAGVKLVAEPAGCKSNYWLQAIVLNEGRSHERDRILALTNEAGLMTRPAWVLLHRLPMYERAPRADLKVAESLERRIINVPSSAGLV